MARDVLSRNQLERCGSPVRLKLRNEGVAIVAMGREGGDAQNGSIQILHSGLHGLLRSTMPCCRSSPINFRNVLHSPIEHSPRTEKGQCAHELPRRLEQLPQVLPMRSTPPLTVIAGRSHLLAECLSTTELGESASEVKVAAMKVAEIVEALAESAAPIEIAATTRMSVSFLPMLAAILIIESQVACRFVPAVRCRLPCWTRGISEASWLNFLRTHFVRVIPARWFSRHMKASMTSSSRFPITDLGSRRPPSSMRSIPSSQSNLPAGARGWGCPRLAVLSRHTVGQ